MSRNPRGCLQRLGLLAICLLGPSLARPAVELPAERRGSWEQAGCLRGPVAALRVDAVHRMPDYGARPGDAAGSPANLQALEAVLALPRGDGLTLIWFPAGDYRFESPLIFTAEQQMHGVVLVGDGAGRTRLQFDFNGGTGNCITFAGSPGGIPADAHVPFGADARPIVHVGLENLAVQRLDDGSSDGYTGMTVSFRYARDAWLAGVESAYTARYHVYVAHSERVEIRGCYLHHAYDYGGGGHGYGVYIVDYSRHCLVEDNVFNHLRHAMILFNGAHDNVFGYNLSVDPHKTEYGIGLDATGDMVLHGRYTDDIPGPGRNLFEGNVGGYMTADGSHEDNGPHNTFFRNRATRYGVTVHAASPFQNVLANEVSLEDGTFPIWFRPALDVRSSDCLVAGNTVDGRVPPASGCVTASSLYLDPNRLPGFLRTTAPYPAIGCHPGGTGGGTIPAHQRWLANSEDPTVPRQRAVSARAGEDRAVTAGLQILLDGSGSFALPGGVVGATWRQVFGPLVDLQPGGKLAARFQAPGTGGENIELGFELTVSGANGARATDRCRVAVNPADGPALGDVTADGWITLADVLAALQVLSGKASSSVHAGRAPDAGLCIALLKRLAAAPVLK